VKSETEACRSTPGRELAKSASDIHGTEMAEYQSSSSRARVNCKGERADNWNYRNQDNCPYRQLIAWKNGDQGSRPSGLRSPQPFEPWTSWQSEDGNRDTALCEPLTKLIRSVQRSAVVGRKLGRPRFQLVGDHNIGDHNNIDSLRPVKHIAVSQDQPFKWARTFGQN
jgi:hypothetical protein